MGPSDNMPPKEKIRADELLVRLNLCQNRSQGLALIMAGRVLGPDGQRVDKGGKTFGPEDTLSLTPSRQFVSRGGHKLAGALDDLGVDPAGYNALDVGASTGGFTDCLLQAGAAAVTAVDVGRGLIDQGLRNDPRVTLVEGLNARHIDEIDPEKLKAPFDLAVADLSFISLSLILPKLSPLLKPDGRVLAMVKPQFEVGRRQVGKGGLVKDPELIRSAVDKIAALGPDFYPPLRETGRSYSKLTGKDGNQEVFLLFSPTE
ncbi:MAG: TlyA family RNA methyltransferase [Deltaproteobacteria bacterium]|jgi:23S rRNA (cytidine1920-2'-O)/16S rRNA (cytidine1409-2'-O)-methyltransferase|nr:TlyA family RNA methyltransferase [Deltaproteobacteria bacterium]